MDSIKIYICYSKNEEDRTIAQKLYDAMNAQKLYDAMNAYQNSNKRKQHQRICLYLERNRSIIQNDKLDQQTKDIINEMSFLIVICTPQSKESRRVNELIQYFLSAHKRSNILLVFFKGENPAEAFPPILISDDGPLAADIRSDRLKDSIKKIKYEKFRIIAAIIGCNFDDLYQRHQKRKKEKLYRILTICSFLLIVAIGVISSSIINNNKYSEMLQQQTAISNKLVVNYLKTVPAMFSNNKEAYQIVENRILNSSQIINLQLDQDLIKSFLEISPSDTYEIALKKASYLRRLGYSELAFDAYKQAEKYFENEDLAQKAMILLKKNDFKNVKNLLYVYKVPDNFIIRRGDIIYFIDNNLIDSYDKPLWANANARYSIKFLRIDDSGSISVFEEQVEIDSEINISYWVF